MESKEKVMEIPFDNKRYFLKFDLFKCDDHQQKCIESLHRNYDQQGNLQQQIKKEFFTKDKERKIIKLNQHQNINQTEHQKQFNQIKLPLLNQREHQNNNNNLYQLNTSQILNCKKQDNSRPGSEQSSQNKFISIQHDNKLTLECQKKSNFRQIKRPPSNTKRTQQPVSINEYQKIEQKELQNQYTQLSNIPINTYQQPIVYNSCFRYNQNLLYSDIDLLDNNYQWLPNTILNAMANKHNQDLYNQYFDRSIVQPALIHVFPTDVYDEIERQRKYNQQNKKFIDCFVYTQEIKFLQEILLKIYDKFYFLASTNCHYFLIEVLLQKSVINIYDSMYQRENYGQKIIRENIENILMKYKINLQFQTSDIQPYPRQKDNSNCGVFALYYLKQLLAGNDLRNHKTPILDTQNFRQELKKILNPKMRIQMISG